MSRESIKQRMEWRMQTYATIDSEGGRSLFWFSVPENQTIEQAFNTQTHHLIRFEDAGTWDPAWDKPQ